MKFEGIAIVIINLFVLYCHNILAFLLHYILSFKHL